MEYNFNEVELKWQKKWAENNTYKVEVDKSKPKYYVLDMFPYPSGAGLHVGHPLGYIASDIYSRYKTLKGFNVLHPMGFDAYGLPAEQYAIQTGTHPAITTEENIKRYKEQLSRLGFSYDWSREVRTCDPKYYKWTQWAFIKMFNSWFNKSTQRASQIEELINIFDKEGNTKVDAAHSSIVTFSANEWKNMSEKQQQEMLMHYRLAYLANTMVNWCPELGTVLANDEVKDGVSERGGHPVVRKEMRQWCLRISAYADRFLRGINNVDWSESIKEVQKNWIGRSEGATVFFKIKDHKESLEIFTTRPDTIFGSTYMVVAPEHELLKKITTEEQKEFVESYVNLAVNRSERERQAEVKTISGVFTGAYAEHPFTGKLLPIWTADYVLAGYGTGAIMAVPAHDSRDYAFAKHFKLPIVEVVSGGDITDESYDAKQGKLINSDFLNGMEVSDAISFAVKKIEEKEIGKGKVNYRLRDAIFSRQRYWGEPFPIYYKDDIPYAIDEDKLPLLLPEIDAYLPTETGEPPLGRAKDWKTPEGYPMELSTMPGFAGSSAYFVRYMDPDNSKELVNKDVNEYWRTVDLYIGGMEHATGHLIYARFWNKVLYDLGYVCEKEPFNKLINQGMIQGRSSLVYRIKDTNTFVSHGLKNNYSVTPLHVDVSFVHNDVLDLEQFKKWRKEFNNAEFILEDSKYICGHEVEKMSKRFYNVVNPDDLADKYGADTLRLYEMFLGPLEQHKPWDTNGIEGVFRFVKKLWRLFYQGNDTINLSEEKPTLEEYKVFHRSIKRIEDDIERFSFNTVVSSFMICVNELHDIKCNKKEILEQLLIMISPFAPHISEELWSLLGHKDSVTKQHFPKYNEEYLKESNFEYPVSFNGKMRFKVSLPVDLSKEEVEKHVLSMPESQKWISENGPKKVIVVPNRIVNIVV